MSDTKLRFGKTGGNLAYHAYMSFPPAAVTPELCHQIGVELARRLWGDKYEVLVTTHLNTHLYLKRVTVYPDHVQIQLHMVPNNITCPFSDEDGLPVKDDTADLHIFLKTLQLKAKSRPRKGRDRAKHGGLRLPIE